MTDEAGAVPAPVTQASQLVGEGAGGRFGRNSLLALAATVVVGIGNYGFGLALVWILPGAQFAVVASVNSLLVIVGTAGSAALPWLVAGQVARHPAGSRQRREAVSFALAASLASGAVATVVVVAIASTYANSGVLVALAVTTVALFAGSTGIGFLEGNGRFVVLAVLSLTEVVLKIGIGSALAAAGLGPTGAVAGAALGALVLAGVSLRAVGAELAWPGLRVERDLWRQSRGIGAIQVAVAVAATLDVVVGSLVDGGSRSLGGYQAMLVFARAPLFVSGALSLVVYPRLAGAGGDRRSVIRQTILLYAITGVLLAVTVASLPGRLLDLVLPTGYATSYPLLLPLALAGLAAGSVNLVTTFLQADGAFAPAIRILSLGLIALVVLETSLATPLGHLAWAAAAGDAAVASALAVLAVRRFGLEHLVVPLGATGVLAVGGFWVLRAARPVTGVWLALVVVAAAVALLAARRCLRPPRYGARHSPAGTVA